MAKKKDEGKKNNGWLKKAAAIAGTFIVVGGIAVIALIAQGSRKSEVDKQEVGGESSRGAVQANKGPGFLAVDADGARFVSLDGARSRKAVWPDDVSSLGKPLSQLKGADGRSGQDAWLDSGFKRASSTAVRSSDGRRTAWLGSDKRDGGATVLVQLGNEQTAYALRLRNGRRIAGVQLVGWTGPQELAFVGAATDTRWIFLLDMDGSVSQFATVPEQAWLFRASDGAVYYSTAETGEGIEAPQQPPSAIWKVGLGGKAEKLANETSGVIQAFVVSGGRAVYSLEDGSLKAVKDSLTSAAGNGIPVLDLGQLGILVRRPDGLYVLSGTDASSKKTDLPLDASIFVLDDFDFGLATSTQ